MKLHVKRKGTIISPDNKRVIARYFFNGETRAEMLIKKILALPADEIQSLLSQNLREFSKRHRSITNIYKKHYKRVKNIVERVRKGNILAEAQKLLIGAYFTMEYALESAALFNPSIIEDFDQGGLTKGQKRVILSLRATGEGHISSIVFRRAILTKENDIILQEPGNRIAEAQVIKNHLYKKSSFISKLTEMGIGAEFYNLVLDQLPEKFPYEQISDAVRHAKEANGFELIEQRKAIDEILWLADSYTEIKFSLDTDLSERVIFPISKFETKGIEDARFTRFIDENGTATYYGTYTAYDGHTILPRLIKTENFYSFKIFPLHGQYAVDKNMALFPRKVNGQYVMISRLNGFNNYIMFSHRINHWNDAELLQEPIYPWELVQIGNGGSPIETKEGWLMITHGVGPVRKYCLGACLLDLDDPRIVIGRLSEPLLLPIEGERAGYVPNVVYTCGAYVHDEELVIPYAMSDYASAFATVNLNDLLVELKKKD